MSRIGRKPINLKDVELTISSRQVGSDVTVTGKLGSLTMFVPGFIELNIQDSTDGDCKYLNINVNNKKFNPLWGLYRTLIDNMVQGVTKGFTKELVIQGIGYRAEMKGNSCVFSLGLSHKITFEPPPGVTLEVKEQTNIIVSGIDKQKVGEVAAKIRSFRKPEPYKGKGIRYKDEIVRRKSTKTNK